MLQKLKSFLGFLTAFVYPPTKAKLHRLITWIGVVFAGYAMVLVWAGQLGISTTEGKLGATVGILTTLAAGWQRVKPKLDAAVDALPIPADDPQGAQPAPVIPIGEGQPGPKIVVIPRSDNRSDVEKIMEPSPMPQWKPAQDGAVQTASEPTPVTVENPTGGQAAAKGSQKP